MYSICLCLCISLESYSLFRYDNFSFKKDSYKLYFKLWMHLKLNMLSLAYQVHYQTSHQAFSLTQIFYSIQLLPLVLIRLRVFSSNPVYSYLLNKANK